MSEFLDRISKLSPQRLALLADELNQRLQAAENSRRVPLAIIGIGCKLPGGVHDPDSFWDLLRDGVDAVKEVPLSRWDTQEFYDHNPATPGKMATRWGGFIDDPDQFDPKFFGIAPTEAVSMDPQQRMLLETSWETLENAGIAPSLLAGSPTGVFVGICNGDYSQVALNSPRDKISPYFAPGLSHAVAAGRISYVLGLLGPSLAVDTSCSASLVAVHLACQSLRLGECNLALAGGVNLILNPDITIALSQSRMMAPDGRCKAFDESADGFVRGEGCGMILLKRLPDAIRDRNRILAVIRGTACNQDGRSSGLTAPNGPSQEAVIAAALADAGMNANDVDSIEAHGTGTALGDPIEAGALNAVFAQRTKNSGPLFVGSVKTNLGHLESAAGIAGLIKLVLSIQHGEIPASLHFEKPNRQIEWARLPIEIPTKLQPWNRRGAKRAAGVSSFGFSGTNAHVIVEEYMADARAAVSFAAHPDPAEEQACLFPLSGKSRTALRTIADRLHHHLIEHPSVPLADIARTLMEGRSHFEFRAAIVAATHAELLGKLQSFREEAAAASIQAGHIVAHSPRIGFIFGEEDASFQNPGRQLYAGSAVFRESVQRCEEILRDELKLTLRSPLFRSGECIPDSLPDMNDNPPWVGRVAAFVFQLALAELWRSRGIQPAVVFGYEAGEIAAACIAGMFSLRDGLRLVIADGDERKECANSIRYSEPKVTFLANGNERIEKRAGVSSAEYWRSGPVLPSQDALRSLSQLDCAAYLLIGVRTTTDAFTQFAGKNTTGKFLASFDASRSHGRQSVETAAALYVLGCQLEAGGFSWNATASIVALPTYPFERERYWLDPAVDVRGRGEAERVRLGQNDLVSRAVDTASDPGLDRQTANANEWIYELVWEPTPLPARVEPERSMVKLDEDLIANMAVLPADEDLIHIGRGTVALAPICATYVLQAFQNAGLSPLPTSPFSLEDLTQRLKIVPARRRVLARLMAMLVEDKIVERTGSLFRFVDFSPWTEAGRELDKFRDEYPESRTEIEILRRCGEKLAAVLQGKYDPMQLVFNDGSIEEAEQIYERSPVCRFFNERAARVVHAAVDSIRERPARILEIGGGTGATTVSILSKLTGKNVGYCFTDVSPVFLSRGRAKFANIPSMNYRVLDIEKDPVEQGFDAGEYDVVLAANVLHATADLRRTLSHVRTMLAPGGILLLVEGVRPDRWLDLTFGLTDGWWRFTDLDLRPEHPLISAEVWDRVLRDSGFGPSRNISYIHDDGLLSQQTIIVAQVNPVERAAKAVSLQRTRQWIVLADEFGVGDALHSLLVAQGESCETIRRPENAGEIASEFRKLAAKRPQNGSLEIVYLWGMDVPDSINRSDSLAQAEELCGKTLVHLVQNLLHPVQINANLWIATRGAQATDSYSPTIGGSVQSIAWGIGRVLGLEAPGQYGGLIDLDPALTPEPAAANLLAELLTGDLEDQIAYRGGERLAARLQRATLKKPIAERKNGIRKDGSYLIVGGLGGVGLRVAKWIAEQRPAHLVLLSRTGTSEAGPFAAERRKAIGEIEALGVNVTVVQGDVASAADMELLFGRFGMELPELRGVFHAATVASAAKLGELTDETVDRMFRPKVLGTWILHELTKTMALDFFLVFSSTTSVLGSEGLAHYAAANQFLDSFAHYRRALGLPMLSINWGAWDTMRFVSPEYLERFSGAGLQLMSSDKVIGTFPDLISSKGAQVMIADLDWSVLKPVFEAQRIRPLLKNFGKSYSVQPSSRLAPVLLTASLDGVMEKTPQTRRHLIEAFISEQAAQVLGIRGGELPASDVPLTDLGLDSLMAVDLRNRLQAGLGQELSPTVVFDYPNISAMAGLLETILWAAHDSLEPDLAISQKDEIRI